MDVVINLNLRKSRDSCVVLLELVTSKGDLSSCFLPFRGSQNVVSVCSTCVFGELAKKHVASKCVLVLLDIRLLAWLKDECFAS